MGQITVAILWTCSLLLQDCLCLAWTMVEHLPQLLWWMKWVTYQYQQHRSKAYNCKKSAHLYMSLALVQLVNLMELLLGSCTLPTFTAATQVMKPAWCHLCYKFQHSLDNEHRASSDFTNLHAILDCNSFGSHHYWSGLACEAVQKSQTSLLT